MASELSRQPVVFLSTREEWNFSLWSSSKVELLHPEWGMITVLVSVVKASLMSVILMASHDDKFHTTPVETRAKTQALSSGHAHLRTLRYRRNALKKDHRCSDNTYCKSPPPADQLRRCFHLHNPPIVPPHHLAQI
ncbi:hypothetical protein EYF80_005229 [Liparis tanakae]|uniref:Uncharacterized protein n=1 Tax=Liparis tanakae TaxID=230148 RepID=A0A4Z2J2T9_9TELE|nr:hypothetical protein EYF80_005229 [Liparis tanakae]